MLFNKLYELLHSATRQRSAYEELYKQTFYARMVQVTPKLHFNIEKIPRERRLDSTDDRASQRKHEYVLIARFRAGAHAEQDDALSRRSITCKLANRVLEPFFVHPAVRTRSSM
jgi:exopolysaccharide biosynthesis predicted pyruvyltransferase EpsI